MPSNDTRNQPKYVFFKNFSYAINGLKDIMKNETSFKIELIIFILLCPALFLTDIELMYKIAMISSFFFVLICEAINSAVERTVDLVTLEYHEMAKRAKDAGSAVVLLSIVMTVCIWASILFDYWG